MYCFDFFFGNKFLVRLHFIIHLTFYTGTYGKYAPATIIYSACSLFPVRFTCATINDAITIEKIPKPIKM